MKTSYATDTFFASSTAIVIVVGAGLAAIIAFYLSGTARKTPETASSAVVLQLREIGGRQYVVATSNSGSIAIAPYSSPH